RTVTTPPSTPRRACSGLMGSVASTVGLLTPAYRLTFRDANGTTGKVVDTTTLPQASTVTDLAIDVGMDGGADSVVVRMGQVGHFRPAVGEELDVELGFADDDGGLQQVVTSTVVQVDPGLVDRRLVAHGPADKLLHTFVDRTFEGKSAGAIVTELAA